MHTVIGLYTQICKADKVIVIASHPSPFGQGPRTSNRTSKDEKSTANSVSNIFGVYEIEFMN